MASPIEKLRDQIGSLVLNFEILLDFLRRRTNESIHST